MNARLHPAVTAVLTPATQRYAVTLKFTDGIYENRATTTSPEHAIHLALVDARMGWPFNTYFGELISSYAELAPL